MNPLCAYGAPKAKWYSTWLGIQSKDSTVNGSISGIDLWTRVRKSHELAWNLCNYKKGQ